MFEDSWITWEVVAQRAGQYRFIWLRAQTQQEAKNMATSQLNDPDWKILHVREFF